MDFLTTSLLLDACVLAIISKGDTYGYALTQRVGEIMEISDRTLYPVLRRLQKNHQLETYDKSAHGHTRRYYRITPLGCILLEEYRDQWQVCKKSLDKILKGKLKP